MLRRNFFRWISTTVVPFLLPRLARAQANGLDEGSTPLLLEIGAVVLPGSLGRNRTDEIARRFAEWTRNYKAGADAGYGYGFPRVQVLPPNPAANYPGQLQQLEAAAGAKGSSFAKLDLGMKRELVAAAIEAASIDRIPPRPNGKHVAVDLMSFFYNSADGQDFLYNAAIKRDDCRGLANAPQRPAPLA